MQIRGGNQFIQVFQSNVIFHQQDDVVRGKFFGISTFTHSTVEIFEIGHAFFPQSGAHTMENSTQRLRIIGCAVVIERFQSVIFGDGIQSVTLQIRVYIAGESHGIQIGVFERIAVVFTHFADKAGIKRSVVCNEDSVAAEGEKLFHRIFRKRGVFHHIIGDTGDGNDVLGNGYTGIDKGGKPIENFPILIENGTDFGDFAGEGR